MNFSKSASKHKLVSISVLIYGHSSPPINFNMNSPFKITWRTDPLEIHVKERSFQVENNRLGFIESVHENL